MSCEHCERCDCMKIVQLVDIKEKFKIGTVKAIAYRNKAREEYVQKDVTMAQVIKANNLEA